MSSSIIEAKEIYKAFNIKDKKIEVLKGISFTIKEGNFVSIMGPSGAGKSTLLHILAGLESLDKGNVIYYKNISIVDKSQDFLSKFRLENIGFVFQNHLLLPEFSAYENIIIPAIAKGIDEYEYKDRALYLMERLNIIDRKNHFPSELSGGERQRVAIARALINNPKIIFADEPTGNLDRKNSFELMDLFKDISESFNLTVVYVTHDEEISKFAEEVYYLIDGVIRN